MKTNLVREMLRAGRPTLGCFLGLGSPNVTELLAHLGLDWLVIEAEHTPLAGPQVEHNLMAMNGTNTVPLVRLLRADPFQIQQVLDTGAMGVVLPLVRTADEARAIVSATRYPPAGTRRFRPLRAYWYSTGMHDYFARANENMLVALIIETKEAVQNLEEIAAVPGIDALIPGPMDLCLSLGLDPMRQPHPEIKAITRRML